MEGVQRKAGWWTSERYFPSPNMRKSISGKRYLDSFIKLSSQQNTQQTMEGRRDIAAVNMKSSPAVQRVIKSLAKNHTSPLDVCARHRCGPCAGGLGAPVSPEKWVKIAPGGISVTVRWLKCHTSTAEGVGSRPGWRS